MYRGTQWVRCRPGYNLHQGLLQFTNGFLFLGIPLNKVQVWASSRCIIHLREPEHVCLLWEPLPMTILTTPLFDAQLIKAWVSLCILTVSTLSFRCCFVFPLTFTILLALYHLLLIEDHLFFSDISWFRTLRMVPMCHFSLVYRV